MAPRTSGLEGGQHHPTVFGRSRMEQGGEDLAWPPAPEGCPSSAFEGLRLQGLRFQFRGACVAFSMCDYGAHTTSPSPCAGCRPRGAGYDISPLFPTHKV